MSGPEDRDDVAPGFVRAGGIRLGAWLSGLKRVVRDGLLKRRERSVHPLACTERGYHLGRLDDIARCRTCGARIESSP